MPVVIAADGIVVLGLFAIALALILLRRVWVASFGHLLLGLADPFDHAGWTVHVLGHRLSLGFQWVASLLRGVNAAALHLLGAGIDATDSAAKSLWHWTAYFLGSIGRVIGDLAESTEQAIGQLASLKLPGYVRAALHPLASKLEWLTHYVEHVVAHPTTIVRPVTRVLDPRIHRLEAQVARLAHAVGGIAVAPPLPHAIPGIGTLTHGIDELRQQLGKVARVLTPAGIVGLAAAAILQSLDLGWLKCRGVNRAGRTLCGMSGLLETLASDALEALIVSDLCDFVGLLGYAAEQFEPVLLAFVDVEDALIGCRGASRPDDLHVPALSLPPRQQLVTA